MNIPSLPTDNLYKLVTMTGALLVMLSLVLYYITASDFELKLAEVEGTLITAEIEKNRLKEMGLTTMSKPKDEYSQKRIIRFLELQYENRRMHERNRALLVGLKKLRRIVYLSTLLGLVLFSIGISLWYNKLQRYQDILIKAEVKKKQNET